MKLRRPTLFEIEAGLLGGAVAFATIVTLVDMDSARAALTSTATRTWASATTSSNEQATHRLILLA